MMVMMVMKREMLVTEVKDKTIGKKRRKEEEEVENETCRRKGKKTCLMEEGISWKIISLTESSDA